MYVDSHCHLDYHERDGDLDEVVARARRAGVGTLVTICTKMSNFETVCGIAERFDDVWCSLGVHPHEAGEEPIPTVDELVALAAHPKVVGIGETGLDYFYERSPRDAQQACLRVHIDAARETGLPLIVHARDADDDMIEILEEGYRNGPYPGLIHCFTSGPELAEKAIGIGFSISFSGIVTFKNAEDLRTVAKSVPEDRILIETDAPYLAPVPNRGKRNEPAYVVHVAEMLADVRGMETNTLADVTTGNFHRLFNRVTPAG
ncbi:MAG: YchF/TatD family DNA exonuclease [Alphaproteobacteria bacterium]|nr:YchF/TatD family DNA exonuclease [Alphaproteobacteria bacterium]